MSSNRVRVSEQSKQKIEEFADLNGVTQKEAANRLVKQGLEYEQDPGLVDALVRESFTLSVFLTIVLSVFTLIDPAMLYFAIISAGFSVGLGLGIVYRTAEVGFPWAFWRTNP